MTTINRFLGWWQEVSQQPPDTQVAVEFAMENKPLLFSLEHLQAALRVLEGTKAFVQQRDRKEIDTMIERIEWYLDGGEARCTPVLNRDGNQYVLSAAIKQNQDTYTWKVNACPTLAAPIAQGKSPSLHLAARAAYGAIVRMVEDSKSA